ncbi:MAG: hypothetical protein ACYC0I_05435 [Acidimicrobiales bacterium]
MRKLWIVGAVSSSLILAACGVSATINQAISSVGASSNLQVQLSASASGVGASASKAESILNALTVNMNYASTTGAAIDQSTGHVNSEITVNNKSQTIFDVRQIDSNVFVRFDVNAYASLPSVSLSSQQAATLQLVIGDRWFEFTAASLASYLPTTTISAAQTSKAQAAERAMLDALSSLIESSPYTTLANGGYSQTGSLASVVKAVQPALEKYLGKTFTPSNVKGSYTVGITMSGASATGASLAITVPNGVNGNGAVDVHAAISHNNDPVVTPSGATIITKAMLTQLIAEAQGSSSTLG